MTEHSIDDLAGDRKLWEEYIDPENNAPFSEYTNEERKALIREIWPSDFDEEGNPIKIEHEEER